jgi:hypothetical protein
MTRRRWRKFDSPYGWNHPRTPGWLAFTWALRIGLVLVILFPIVRELTQ